MPIQMNEGDGGQFLTVHVSGILAQADYASFVPEFERLVRQRGKLHLLFDMTGFHGWEAAAIWEEIEFDAKHLADIERCAMVGDKQWQHVMTVFCKPFTKAKIQYFDHANFAAAQEWLAQEQKSMDEIKHEPKSHGDPNGGPIHHGHPPYWRRAHRDWRIWIIVILMLVAMFVYLVTGDLRWPFHSHPQPMVPIAG